MMVKKLFSLILVLALLLCGCTSQPEETTPATTTAPKERPKTVGICVPNFDWSDQARKLQTRLEEAGYQVYLEYASDDIQQQQSQVQTLVNMPVGCLVVAAIDTMSLTQILNQARQDDVPVIALDRLPMYTDAVTGCVTMDYLEAGRQIGSYIVQKKQLETAKTPVTIEFFMGEPENSSSLLFYRGVMEQLQPYFNSGILQCRTGRTAFEDTCIQPGTSQTALDRCFDYITESYLDKAPDILCTASDELASGCISALFSLDMGPGRKGGPLITGLGATQDGIGNICQYYQTATVYADSQELVDRSVQWVLDAIADTPLTGEPISNGMVDVPTHLLHTQVIDIDNYKDVYAGEEGLWSTEPAN